MKRLLIFSTLILCLPFMACQSQPEASASQPARPANESTTEAKASPEVTGTVIDLNQMFVEAEDLADAGRHLASAQRYQMLAWLLESYPALQKELSEDYVLEWAQSQASQQNLLAGQQVWHKKLTEIDAEIRERNKKFE